jgi:flagellar biosynthetic protein FliS
MAATTEALAAYARSSATTASPSEIVRMAYERVLTACDRSETAATERPAGWVQVFHDESTRAQAILFELSSVLAMNHPDPAVAELSRQLADLYQFARAELVRANLAKSAEPLASVRMIIDGLRDAWTTSVLSS